MTISVRRVRNAAAGAVGAGALAGAMVFGGAPVAQAAPPPASGTSIAMAGLDGAAGVPLRGGHGWGHGDWGHGDFGRGDWGHGGWSRGGWSRGGDWDDGGWGSWWR